MNGRQKTNMIAMLLAMGGIKGLYTPDRIMNDLHDEKSEVEKRVENQIKTKRLPAHPCDAVELPLKIKRKCKSFEEIRALKKEIWEEQQRV